MQNILGYLEWGYLISWSAKFPVTPARWTRTDFSSLTAWMQTIFNCLCNIYYWHLKLIQWEWRDTSVYVQSQMMKFITLVVMTSCIIFPQKYVKNENIMHHTRRIFSYNYCVFFLGDLEILFLLVVLHVQKTLIYQHCPHCFQNLLYTLHH